MNRKTYAFACAFGLSGLLSYYAFPAKNAPSIQPPVEVKSALHETEQNGLATEDPATLEEQIRAVNDIASAAGIGPELLDKNPLFNYVISDDNIVELNVKECRLPYLDISRLHGLRQLFVFGCGLESIDGIENCRDLESLTLWGNKLKQVQGISGLKKLKTLHLMANQLSEIDVTDCTSLENLTIAYNNISKVEGMSTLCNLSRYNAIHNKLCGACGTANLPYLKTVLLVSNPLQDFHDLRLLCRKGVVVKTSYPEKLKDAGLEIF
jgi:Leucine-rich repeat (LRR) protein